MSKRAVVLDVSTAAKWFLPADTEPLRKEALDLWRRQSSGEFDFLIPDLFWSEFGNVLTKAIRKDRLTLNKAGEALRIMRDVPVVTTCARDLAEAALTIADSSGCSFYDSIYVALAVDANSSLVTADERLANALAARWPVQWLGALRI